MNERIETLLEQIKELETQLGREVQRKEVEFFYEVRQKKIQFTEEAKARNKELSKKIHRSVLDSTFLVISTGPILWLFLLPLIAMDLTAMVYQSICFPIYGIAKVRRADYVLFDRRRLGYLILIEKINCSYFSYANGILAFMVEVAARTEQYWCPSCERSD